MNQAVSNAAHIESDEERALEGMFFSPFDIKLYRSLSDETVSTHLNAYILQAFRIGKASK